MMMICQPYHPVEGWGGDRRRVQLSKPLQPRVKRGCADLWIAGDQQRGGEIAVQDAIRDVISGECGVADERRTCLPTAEMIVRDCPAFFEQSRQAGGGAYATTSLC